MSTKAQLALAEQRSAEARVGPREKQAWRGGGRARFEQRKLKRKQRHRGH